MCSVRPNRSVRPGYSRFELKLKKSTREWRKERAKEGVHYLPSALIEEEAAEEKVEEESELTSIKGIGPSRADQFREMGIETVGELAEADPSAVFEEFEEIGLDEEDVRNWVEKAEEREEVR